MDFELDALNLYLLKKLSKDKNSSIRLDVAEQLVLVREEDLPKAEPILIRMLRDYVPIVRVEACDTLAISKNKEVIKKVEPLLYDKHYQSRGFAARTIASILNNTGQAPDDFLELLKKLIEKEKDSWVRVIYYSVLIQEFHIFDYYEDMLNELKARYKPIRYMILKTLLELDDEDWERIDHQELSEKLTKHLETEKAIAIKNKFNVYLKKLKIRKNRVK